MRVRPPLPIACLLIAVCGTPSLDSAGTRRNALVSAFSTLQAESYDAMEGIVDAGTHIGYLDNGDWVKYSGVDFVTGAGSVQLRVAVDAPYAGSRIELRLDSIGGTLVGTHTVASTGGWSSFQTQTTAIRTVSGVHDLYLVFTGGDGVANLDWFQFSSTSTARSAFATLQAEAFDAMEGILSDGNAVGYADAGDWVKYSDLDFGTGAAAFEVRIAVDPSYAGQQIQIRLDGTAGQLIGTHTVASTGGWGTYQTQSVAVTSVSGVHDLYLLFVGGDGVGNLDWFRFLPSSSPGVSFQGVRNVWITASQWPNGRTQREFARDAVRLYGAENGTPEQKAIAIYYYALRVMGHGGDYFQGPYGQEEDVWDSWMIFHVYAKAHCEWWGWFLIDLWKAYNDNWSFDPEVGVARKVSLVAPAEDPPPPVAGDHVEAALKYTDNDGVARWHVFDGLIGFFVRPRGIDRLATPEEIKADYPTIFTQPYNPPTPFFLQAAVPFVAESDSQLNIFLGNTYPFFYSESYRTTKYKTNFDLRVGESLRRQWEDDGKPVVSSFQQEDGISISTDSWINYWYDNDDQPKDPFNYGVIRPYMRNYPGIGWRKAFGNAYSVYSPDLAGGKFNEGATSFSGVIAKTGDVKLGPGATAAEGNVIYQVRSIYPFAESFIQGTYFLKSSGNFAVDFSLDSGATWITVHNDTTVSATAKSFNIDIGKTRWAAGLPSPYNMPDRDSQYRDGWDPEGMEAVKFTGFQYLVRVRLRADANTNDVGLADLTLRNTHALNIGMLPTLLPGTNTIKVEGELTPGATMQLEYVWMEDQVIKTRVENITSLPHSFDIVVEMPNPLLVKCLHHTLRVLPP